MANAKPQTATEKPPPQADNTEELKTYINRKLSDIEEVLNATLWDNKQQITNYTNQIVSNATNVLRNNINTMFGELYNLRLQVENSAQYASNQLVYTEGKLSGEHNKIITAIDDIDVQLDDVGSSITSDLQRELDDATLGLTNLLDESRNTLSGEIRDTTSKIVRVSNEQTEIISANIIHAQESADERAKRLNNIVVQGIESTGKHITENLAETEKNVTTGIEQLQQTVMSTPEMLITGMGFIWEQMEGFLTSNFDLSFEGMVRLIKDRNLAEEEAAAQLVRERLGA